MSASTLRIMFFAANQDMQSQLVECGGLAQPQAATSTASLLRLKPRSIINIVVITLSLLTRLCSCVSLKVVKDH